MNGWRRERLEEQLWCGRNRRAAVIQEGRPCAGDGNGSTRKEQMPMRYPLVVAVTAAILGSTCPALAEAPYFECAGVYPPRASAKSAGDDLPSPEGVRYALVIFAKFLDDVHTSETPPSYASELLDPNLPGSLAHFYLDMSEDRLLLKGSALSKVYTSQHTAAWYEYFGDFVQEILQAADADESAHFADFDNDGPDGQPNSGDDDGVVDMVFVNVLGELPFDFLKGTASGVASLGMLSYTTSEARNPDGQIVVDSSRGSLQRVRGFAHAVASMAHEYGHILGLPDLYDTSTKAGGVDLPQLDSAGIGNWCLMGRGTMGWSEDATDAPNALCAWSRMQLGWLGPHNERVETVRDTRMGIVIGDVNAGGKVYKIPIREYTDPAGWAEYYLVVNRQASGSYYDRNLPQSGLLIWHIDESAEDNKDETRKLVDLECADGLYVDKGYPGGAQPDPIAGRDNLDFWAHPIHFPGYAETFGGNLGDATDVFDGARYTCFGRITNPASLTNASIPTYVEVRDIRRTGTDMIADITFNCWSGPVWSDAWDPHWPEREVTWRKYLTVDGDVTVPSGVELTLIPGATVRVVPGDRTASGLDPHRCEIVVHGKLTTLMTWKDLIQFTSDAPTPQPGDWYGIRLVGPGATIQIHRTRIDYAEKGISGAETIGNLTLTDAIIRDNRTDGLWLENWQGTLKLLNTWIGDNAAAGVRVVSGGTLLATNTAFERNGEFGVLFDGSGLQATNCQWRSHQTSLSVSGDTALSPFTVERCTFTDNTKAIRNDTQTELSAENNWWGTADPVSIAASIDGPVDWSPFLWTDPTEWTSFVVEPGFPNPFRREATIRFFVPRAQAMGDRPLRVQLTVYNIIGQQVRVLMDDLMYSGIHCVQWDGTDNTGRRLATGAYLLDASTPVFRTTTKMLLLRE